MPLLPDPRGSPTNGVNLWAVTVFRGHTRFHTLYVQCSLGWPHHTRPGSLTPSRVQTAGVCFFLDTQLVYKRGVQIQSGTPKSQRQHLFPGVLLLHPGFYRNELSFGFCFLWLGLTFCHLPSSRHSWLTFISGLFSQGKKRSGCHCCF